MGGSPGSIVQSLWKQYGEDATVNFISNAFTKDGKRNKEGNYPAYKTGCTYCPFKTRHDLCPPKNRVAV